MGTIVPQKEATFNGRDLLRWVLLYLKKRQSLREGPYKMGTIVPQKETAFNGRDLIRWVL